MKSRSLMTSVKWKWKLKRQLRGNGYENDPQVDYGPSLLEEQFLTNI